MNVGKRIRRMREAQDISQDQLAQMADVDTDKLARIEQGDTVPSIGLVLKLSRALGSHAGPLFHEGGSRPDIFSLVCSGDESSVERLSTAMQKTGQGYSYQSLLDSDVRGQGMEPFLVDFDPTAASTVQPMSHQGEEFIHILEGTVELLYDGETYTMKKGDSLYIDSSKPHALRGIGKVVPRALAVIFSRD